MTWTVLGQEYPQEHKKEEEVVGEVEEGKVWAVVETGARADVGTAEPEVEVLGL